MASSYVYVLLLGVLVGVFTTLEATGGRGSPEGQIEEQEVRQNLEREILKHTIQYLRSKLIKCLKDVPGGRTKIDQVLADGPYQPPSTYTYIRVLPSSSRHKRWSLKSQTRKVEDSPVETLFQVDMDVMHNTRDYLYTRALQCLQTQKDHRKGHRLNTSRHRGERDKTRNFLRPSTAPLPATTESTIRVGQTYDVAGKEIECESVTTRPDGSQFLCRNLRVDGKTRLPNWSLCPPRYNPDAWWQLNSIQSATFQVLDLEGFCLTLGRTAGIKGKVVDVKVAWDCDVTQPRLKWLDGNWAGHVDDNGFLRDLNCEYEPIT